MQSFHCSLPRRRFVCNTLGAQNLVVFAKKKQSQSLVNSRFEERKVVMNSSVIFFIFCELRMEDSVRVSSLAEHGAVFRPGELRRLARLHQSGLRLDWRRAGITCSHLPLAQGRLPLIPFQEQTVLFHCSARCSL